ncbi:MAG: lipopolysaccharide biosynthesis protein, partial [Alphaproteobacteria bacterium]
MMKDRALRDRLAKGLGAQGFGQGVNILIQLLTVPLLLATWGVGLYGEWLILAAIPVYLSASDTGFATAATHDMTIAVGRGDRARMGETFQSIWLLLIVVSVAVLAAVALLAFGLPVARWLNLARMTGDAPAWVLVFLGAQVLMTFQTGLVYSGYHCVGAYGLGQALMSLTRLIEFGALAAVVLSGGDPAAAAAALFAGRCVGTVAMRLALYRVNPDLALGWRQARLSTVRRLLGPAWASMGFALGNALNLQGFVIVIGTVIGPTATVAFATLRTMTRFGLQLVNAVNMTVSAEISTAYGAGNRDLLRRLHHRSCQIGLWLAIGVTVGLLLFGPWALTVWTGGRVAMDWPVFAWLLAALVVQSLWHSSLYLEYATNRHMGLAMAYGVVSLASVGAAVGGVAWMGIVGAAAVLFTAQLVMLFVVLP